MFSKIQIITTIYVVDHPNQAALLTKLLNKIVFFFFVCREQNIRVQNCTAVVFRGNQCAACDMVFHRDPGETGELKKKEKSV